jgi:hypothetical protein
MKVTVEVSDKRFPFFMELVKSLGFVKSVKKESSKGKGDKVVTHFSSENVLAKDWLTSEEDEAWKNL